MFNKDRTRFRTKHDSIQTVEHSVQPEGGLSGATVLLNMYNRLGFVQLIYITVHTVQYLALYMLDIVCIKYNVSELTLLNLLAI